MLVEYTLLKSSHIYIYISCLHYPSSLTFNISPDPELPQTILTRPRTWLTKVQNVSNDCGATMSQLDCRVDISRSFQKKTRLTPTGLKNRVSFWVVWKKKWAQVWNWPNGRWSFTPPSPQEVSPPSQLRSLCNSCHRLLLSHARCPDKKFGQGFLGSLCMRLYYSKRIPIANLIWSPATRWCIYIYSLYRTCVPSFTGSGCGGKYFTEYPFNATINSLQKMNKCILVIDFD